MDFLFAPEEEVDRNQLRQGDLLIRSEELRGVLAQAHQYYADAPTYTHFIVVTQSCDLVKRGRKPPKVPYITVAAVRPLELVLERHLRRHEFLWGAEQTPLGIHDQAKRELAEQFLERLLNNEEKGFFFMKAKSHPSVVEDLCAFLPLSVALKAEHYQALLNAKVAQLEEVFAAKLGWQVGNLYSRVATPDLEESGHGNEKEEFLSLRLGSTRWVSSIRWRELGKELKARKKADQAFEVTPETAASALSVVPEEMELLANRVVEIIRSQKAVTDQSQLEAIKKRLWNDENLRSIAKGVR